MNSFLCVSYAEYSTRFSPSCTVLYCTISAIPQTQSACISASYPFTNAVGYQTKDTVTGFNFVIPSFANVGGGSINIQDIKITGATDWSDNIQILDEGGATIAAYYYATAEQSGAEADGWLDDNLALAEVTLEPGQSILIDTADTATLTFSGQVSTSDTVVETVPGFNFVGNNTPVALDIQDVAIVGATDWSDNIQILDEGGATIAAYYYATAEQSGAEADGWLDDNLALADVTLEPGQGILIDTADVASVTIPGVDLNN